MVPSIERFHCIQDSQLGPSGALYREVPLYIVLAKHAIVHTYVRTYICTYACTFDVDSVRLQLMVDSAVFNGVT